MGLRLRPVTWTTPLPPRSENSSMETIAGLGVARHDPSGATVEGRALSKTAPEGRRDRDNKETQLGF